MRFECPSFAFGTDAAHTPSVLASPLGLMVHTVPRILGLTRGWLGNPIKPLLGVSYSPLDNIGLLHTFEGEGGPVRW